MMMTNVRQFQIPRFPNDKRFQTKLCEEVVSCELSFKVVGYSERWGMVSCSYATLPFPYDEQR